MKLKKMIALFNLSVLFSLVATPPLWAQVRLNSRIRRAIHSVVLIKRMPIRGGRRQGSVGSGVILTSSGYIMTCAHVIASAKNVSVQLYDGRRVKARVIAKDRDFDLAVLKIRLRHLIKVKRALEDQLNVGDTVYAIGNPYGAGHTVTKGVVSALNRSRLAVNQYESYIQFDASISPGNSGGALLNANGDLVGVVAAVLNKGKPNSLGYAIPLHTVNNAFNSLQKKQKISRGALALDVQTMRPYFAKKYGMSNYSGVFITKISSKGLSRVLKERDLIIAINGAPVANSRNFTSAIATRKPGSTVKLTVVRNGETIIVPVVVKKAIINDAVSTEVPGRARDFDMNNFIPDKR